MLRRTLGAGVVVAGMRQIGRRGHGLVGAPWGPLRWNRILLSIVSAACLVGLPMVTAPQASACPSGFTSDPITGQCFTPNSLPTVGGIPCIPGRSLGTCLSILQNQSPRGGGPPPGWPWP